MVIQTGYISNTGVEYYCFVCLQSNTSYVAGCRDSGAVAFTDLYDVLVNLPAREITVATHAKGNSIAFKPCTNVQHIHHVEWCKLDMLCSRVAVFMDCDVWDSDLTWLLIFMLLFWPFVICSDKLDKAMQLSSLLLHRLLSAQTNCLVHYVGLTAFVMYEPRSSSVI